MLPIQNGKKVNILNKNNLNSLNGEYKNVQILPDQALYSYEDYQRTLWQQFNYLQNEQLKNTEYYKVILTVINEKRIKVGYYLKEKLIDERIIKGKINNGYFLSRRKIKAKGIPFIYFKYSETQFQIGINENGDLIVDRFLGQCGMIFILHACPVENFHYFYKRF